MSRDCSYILEWHRSSEPRDDFMEEARKSLIAISMFGLEGKFVVLNEHCAYYECRKRFISPQKKAFKYPPYRILESADGGPFIDLADMGEYPDE